MLGHLITLFQLNRLYSMNKFDCIAKEVEKCDVMDTQYITDTNLLFQSQSNHIYCMESETLFINYTAYRKMFQTKVVDLRSVFDATDNFF
jgi:hypothetical protein